MRRDTPPNKALQLTSLSVAPLPLAPAAERLVRSADEAGGMVTVGELLPKFCTELQDLISSAGRADLVDQVRTLPIVGLCTCGEFNCAHFYTAQPPTKSCGAGHSNLLPRVRSFYGARNFVRYLQHLRGVRLGG